jgi:hypothetical protein
MLKLGLDCYYSFDDNILDLIPEFVSTLLKSAFFWVLRGHALVDNFG